MTPHWIGIDIGKLALDIYDHGKHLHIANNDEAINKWILSLDNPQDMHIVCEPTAGYERPLMRLLRKHNIPTQLAHPSKIRSFAKSKGVFAKTDRIDAKLIAEFAQTFLNDEKPYYLTENQAVLRELVSRRNKLITHRSEEKCLLDKEFHPSIKQSIQMHIDHLDEQIKQIDEAIDQELSDSDETQNLLALLLSIPGVGKITAMHIISYLPETKFLSHKALAALVGVAPFNRDSGRYRGKRYIQGGRAMVRKALYMASLSAIRFNPDIAIFYNRLREKGKPAKLALTAVINKLLGIISSVCKRQSPWVKNMR